jgi:hypothetical protein
MEKLVEHEETIIDAISLSLRNIRFGRGEQAFFKSETEIIATLNFLMELVEEDNTIMFRTLKQVKNDFKDEEMVYQDALTRFRNAVFSEIKTCLNLLANIDKARETMGYQEMWKEQNYGNSEETDNTDEEV